MRPDAVGQIDVGARHVDSDRPGWRIDALDGGHVFLAQVVADQKISNLQQLDRAETPLVLATDEQGMFEGQLDAAVDDEEAVVVAVPHRADGRDHRPHPFRGIGPEPLELRGMLGIAGQTFDIQRRDEVAGFDVLNGNLSAVRKANQRAVKETASASRATRAT